MTTEPTRITAGQVKVGDTIQHPSRHWAARKVLRIEPRPNVDSVRFVLPGIMGTETGVLMKLDVPVLRY